MIKQLDFTQDFSSVKFMDTSTSIGLLLTADGAPFDLSACQTLAVQIANEDGYITTRDIDLSNIDDPVSGEITMPVDGALMAILTPDDYKIEVWAIIKPISIATTSRTATLSIIDGQIEPHTAIFPSDGVLGFTIKENLMTQDGDTIAVISLNEYEERFSQLESSLEAKVATLRGPKGDTGATGPMPDMTGYATNKDVESASTANENYTNEQFGKSVKSGDLIGGRNLIVRTGEIKNQMVSANGTIASFDPSTLMKDYIPVVGGEWLTFHQEEPKGSDRCFRWGWYDDDKAFIGRTATTDYQSFQWQVPDGAAYLRVSYSDKGRVKIERGKVASDWTDAPEELSDKLLLLGGRNYAIGAQKLTATDNGSGNDYPNELLYKINPDVWGKNVTISFTATVSGFTGISDKHLAGDPNPLISNMLDHAVAQDYNQRGTVSPTSDGTYTAVWHGNIGQMTGYSSEGHFKINLNAGAKVTIENMMIELGDVQHDYVPAPEDMVSQSDLQMAINTLKSYINDRIPAS